MSTFYPSIIHIALPLLRMKCSSVFNRPMVHTPCWSVTLPSSSFSSSSSLYSFFSSSFYSKFTGTRRRNSTLCKLLLHFIVSLVDNWWPPIHSLIHWFIYSPPSPSPPHPRCVISAGSSDHLLDTPSHCTRTTAWHLTSLSLSGRPGVSLIGDISSTTAVCLIESCQVPADLSLSPLAVARTCPPLTTKITTNTNTTTATFVSLLSKSPVHLHCTFTFHVTYPTQLRPLRKRPQQISCYLCTPVLLFHRSTKNDENIKRNIEYIYIYLLLSDMNDMMNTWNVKIIKWPIFAHLSRFIFRLLTCCHCKVNSIKQTHTEIYNVINSITQILLLKVYEWTRWSLVTSNYSILLPLSLSFSPPVSPPLSHLSRPPSLSLSLPLLPWDYVYNSTNLSLDLNKVNAVQLTKIIKSDYQVTTIHSSSVYTLSMLSFSACVCVCVMRSIAWTCTSVTERALTLQER